MRRVTPDSSLFRHPSANPMSTDTFHPNRGTQTPPPTPTSGPTPDNRKCAKSDFLVDVGGERVSARTEDLLCRNTLGPLLSSPRPRGLPDRTKEAQTPNRYLGT